MADKIDDKTAARALLKALKVLQDEFETGDVPMHQAAVLLTIALEEDKDGGLEVSDVSEATGLSGAATSRNLSALGEWHRLQRPGLKLVDVKPKLEDRRRKKVELTDEGHRLIKKLRAEMQKEWDK